MTKNAKITKMTTNTKMAKMTIMKNDKTDKK